MRNLEHFIVSQPVPGRTGCDKTARFWQANSCETRTSSRMPISDLTSKTMLWVYFFPLNRTAHPQARRRWHTVCKISTPASFTYLADALLLPAENEFHFPYRFTRRR
jgi:hypothetical protein